MLEESTMDDTKSADENTEKLVLWSIIFGFSNPLFAPNACFSLLAYMLKLATDARCFTVVLQFRHSIWKKETPEEILFVARHDVGGHCISEHCIVGEFLMGWKRKVGDTDSKVNCSPFRYGGIAFEILSNHHEMVSMRSSPPENLCRVFATLE